MERRISDIMPLVRLVVVTGDGPLLFRPIPQSDISRLEGPGDLIASVVPNGSINQWQYMPD